MKKINLTENKEGLIEIIIDGSEIVGVMYGDDECYENGKFYQYFVTLSGNLLKLFYEVPEGDLDTIDYSEPVFAEIAIMDNDISHQKEIDLCFDVKYWNRIL